MRAVFQQPHDGDVCDALCDLLVSSAPIHMHAIQDALEPGCPPSHDRVCCAGVSVLQCAAARVSLHTPTRMSTQSSAAFALL